MKTLGYPTFWMAGLLIALIVISIISISTQQIARSQSTPQKINSLDKSSKIFLNAQGHPTEPSQIQRAMAQASFQP